MKKKLIITIFIAICLIAVLYPMIFRPYNWKISNSDVRDISVNGHTIKDSEISNVVAIYNNLYDVKKRTNTEGSTPEFTMTINLKSGSKITIQDVSDTKLIMDKTIKNEHMSYWVKSNKLYDLMKKYK